jgi:hypothetical protein
MAKGVKTGGGSRKGVPNRGTQEAREAIGAFVDGNAHRLQDWLDRIAVDDPERAFSLFQSVIEYHVPKLGRTEVTGKNGGPLEQMTTINVQFAGRTVP